LKTIIEDAVTQGAKVVNENGGLQVGPLCYPAILFPVREGMKVYREEQFGPVIPVCSFQEIEEPLEYIRSSEHGQQVSIFGSDPNTLAELIDPLINQVSRVNINAQCQRGPDVLPFTGRKDSAEGTLSVLDALRTFSIRALVATKSTEENRRIINDIVHNNRSNFLSTRYII
jgi:glyceraldehyde-3-phosphate dehydrogenase (NADP+)